MGKARTKAENKNRLKKIDTVVENLDALSKQIFEVHHYFKRHAVREINSALTLRNWITGHYLVEYEQSGNDRAVYGDKTIVELSEKLNRAGVKGFSDRNLRLCRQFYLEYPSIWQFVIAKFKHIDNQGDIIWQLITAKSSMVLKEGIQVAVAHGK